VASLGAKLLIDRTTLPRVWARAAPVDPDLPIRGRYVRLRVEAASEGEVPVSVERGADRGALAPFGEPPLSVMLSVRDGQMVATPAAEAEARTLAARRVDRNGRRVVVVDAPLAYFLPEHALDPSVRAPGEELWVEVTVPRSGPPRPIRLGVKKDGKLAVLE
jgi:hypothetical protein